MVPKSLAPTWHRRVPWKILALGLIVLSAVGADLGGERLLGSAGAEVYGHAWVQWWTGEGLDVSALVDAPSWTVIDPLPTWLGGHLGALLGYGLSWNLLGLGAVLLAFVGGAVLARQQEGSALVGGTVLALGPIFLGSVASGLTEDFALGLVALAYAAFGGRRPWLGGLLLGLAAWCGLLLAFAAGLGALVLGLFRLRREPGSWKGVALAGLLAVLVAAPAGLQHQERLGGEGHRAGQVFEREEPLWRLNPWKGADLASFWVPGPQQRGEALVRLHPTYLGLVVLLLALRGGRSRWWALLLGAGVLALGPRLNLAGSPLGVDNPAVWALQRLPFGGLVNHHGRLFLIGQIALSVLAARGLRGLPELPVVALIALELGLVSPLPLPLPTTPGALDPVLSELREGAVLVVPGGGPGVAYQRPLFEQRAHRLPLRMDPNMPGYAPALRDTPLGGWLGQLAITSTAPAPAALEVQDLVSQGVRSLYVRAALVAAVEDALGPPLARSDQGAIWELEDPSPRTPADDR